MATLFTITKNMGVYGKGKNRSVLEVDETACLFGADLWDMVKGYGGLRGVSPTAALMKEVLIPKRLLNMVDGILPVEYYENNRWYNKKTNKLSASPKLKKLDTYGDTSEWLWGENDEFDKDLFRWRQAFKIDEIKNEIKEEENRQKWGQRASETSSLMASLRCKNLVFERKLIELSTKSDKKKESLIKQLVGIKN